MPTSPDDVPGEEDSQHHSSSGDSGTDYSQTRQAELAQRQKHAERGEDVEYTDDEDDATSGEEEADPNSDCTKQTSHAGRKGKEIDGGKKSGKHGPLSKAARDECIEFGKRVAEEAAELAKKFGKSKSTILMTAGLKLQETRDLNPYCKFRSWYARHHPMAPGCECRTIHPEQILIWRGLFAGFQCGNGCGVSFVQGQSQGAP